MPLGVTVSYQDNPQLSSTAHFEAIYSLIRVMTRLVDGFWDFFVEYHCWLLEFETIIKRWSRSIWADWYPGRASLGSISYDHFKKACLGVRDIVSKLFFAEEENHTRAPRWASNLWPLHVNVEILSRSPQETNDFTGMLENDEIKHKI